MNAERAQSGGGEQRQQEGLTHSSATAAAAAVAFGEFTFTTSCALLAPPGPTHSRLNVDCVASAGVLSLPVAALVPDHAPDAVHAVALVDDQCQARRSAGAHARRIRGQRDRRQARAPSATRTRNVPAPPLCAPGRAMKLMK